jgi:uncharacterized protein RhaS with RHS repeats
MKIFAALLLAILLIPNIAYGIYDPTEGRWITRDPIQEQGGLNLYAYCGNNPISLRDPSGKGTEEEAIAIPQALSQMIEAGQYDAARTFVSTYGSSIEQTAFLNAQIAIAEASSGVYAAEAAAYGTGGAGATRAALQPLLTSLVRNPLLSNLAQCQKQKILSVGIDLLKALAKKAGEKLVFNPATAANGVVGFTGQGVAGMAEGEVPSVFIDSSGGVFQGALNKVMNQAGELTGYGQILP